ncbi:uncharacterized protein LOC123354626 [Mauremys mutica]|uniref:uncharacterized protein LOC123354626 n=1 Tax=Mauremys mutica TaxID=74926 RepID=UPI001D16E592|nr:uncharacterized protein LOC123354626 [Mauremys mutica]
MGPRSHSGSARCLAEWGPDLTRGLRGARRNGAPDLARGLRGARRNGAPDLARGLGGTRQNGAPDLARGLRGAWRNGATISLGVWAAPGGTGPPISLRVWAAPGGTRPRSRSGSARPPAERGPDLACGLGGARRNEAPISLGVCAAPSGTGPPISLGVDGKKQKMDTWIFYPLLGEITNPSPPLESSWLYSNRSVCGDDTNTATSFQYCTKERAQITLSYSGSGPDMFRLVSSILEEAHKPEPVTDWNSLLRLFPPMLASDTGNNGDLSGLSSEHRLQSKDFPNPSGTRNCYQGHLRKLSAVETSHRVFDNLYLIESLLSPSDPSTQPSDEILNIYPENSAFENNAIIQQEELAFQNVQFNQHVCNYHKMNLNGDREENCSDFSYYSSQFRVKDGTGIQKEYRETDRARGNPMKNEKQAQAKYSNDLSSPPTNGTWGKVFQDNHLVSKRYEDFTTSRKSQPSSYPLQYFFNQPFTKENRFSGGTNRNPQEAHMQNGQNRFNLGKTCNDIEYESRINPKECSRKSCDYHLLLKTALQHRNFHSPYRGHTSLDDKRPSPPSTSNPSFIPSFPLIQPQKPDMSVKIRTYDNPSHMLKD